MKDDLANFLLNNNIKSLYCERLSNHTTFKIGGIRDCVAMPDTVLKASLLVKYLKENNIKHCYLGNGSNVLFPDEGYDGVVVKTALLNDIKLNDFTVSAGAGVTLTTLSKFTAEKSLSGLEFSYGIPGNVGGAVFMNAGAYDGQISDCLSRVEYLDENGDIKNIVAEECQYGYRHSVFMENDWLIVSAVFNLEKGDRNNILAYMESIMEKRRLKQPLDKPSAGSSFKRPAGHFAGALIDSCGLKGLSVGGAQVSKKHAGFIVNTGGATCSDVLKLADIVRKKVMEQTGVKLEKEIIVIN